MSDTPLGPDWWQASDDKWYPPPRPEMPGEEAPADASALPPPQGSPGGAPMGPPLAPPSGGYAPPGGFPPGGTPSPYTGVPPAGPPPGAQNRTPLYVAIGVVVAVAIVGLIIVLTSGDDGDDERTDRPDPRPSTTEEAPDPTGSPEPTEDDDPPSDSGTVEVVEVGWSNFMGGFDRDELSASYGFIVENTGDETVTDIQVSVSAYDANGTALATASHTIYMLRPGQKMGIGDEFFGENLTAEVADVQVNVSEPENWSLSDIPEEGVLEAEGVTTTTSDYDVTTTFTIRSTFDQQISSPYGYAIYRDASGNIIGGSTGYLNFVPAGGTTAGEITSWEVIPNIASTEVYIDVGFIG
jgi:hypothetical protein